ncbi:GNAT family N-acetyltransferase [Clostridium chauvoei]|uniref:GNAT family N-acetyltransferase n=2 Tax=Clostridium chauvoei TaxID=46867 RepID=A0ABD4RK63_9CLOT|nr:GNAT family N-acetyltransferase [Clostridium chauvoei]ATD54465.1 GNAT family N-acetyltransferase [Clostridium chauvoei]ATD57851.1 GNAT family N-acetyltransferase [Clostridium chauvoei]MBX7281703.1 GNAT family N-acetyltransferase [Clostridium chauvoei]MBX7284236.1 GNAT family N-acetyltransferase [Clostridium chauvoei]MBX7286751.1 GNAT family N-acetyltransferase [Clostridium chauvoei]
MRYEEMKKEDIEILTELYINAFNREPWNDKWTIETVIKRLTQMVNCEGFYGMVAYEEDKPVGVILGNHEYYYNGMQFNIKEFCVDTTIQSKGLGSIVLEEFTSRLKSRGIDEITLLTTKSEKAEGFYKKRGFDSIENMVTMRKKLR